MVVRGRCDTSLSVYTTKTTVSSASSILTPTARLCRGCGSGRPFANVSPIKRVGSALQPPAAEPGRRYCWKSRSTPGGTTPFAPPCRGSRPPRGVHEVDRDEVSANSDRLRRLSFLQEQPRSGAAGNPSATSWLPTFTARQDSASRGGARCGRRATTVCRTKWDTFSNAVVDLELSFPFFQTKARTRSNS